MFIEFALEISRGVHRAYGSRAETLLGIALEQSALSVRDYSILEIDRPPEQIDARVSSAIAFKLAKLLNDTRGETESARSPADVAARIVSAMPAENFIFEIGGGGHINAVPRPDFRRMLAVAMSAPGAAEKFFSSSSWFVPAAPQAAEWNLAAAWERLRELADPQAVQLLERAGKSPSHDDAVMLLSLLADEEIDAKNYLSGLSGRENTPWYLRRFFSDAARFPAELAPSADAEKLFEPTIDLLLETRHEFLNALRFRREEKFLAHVLRLVSDFYRAFHDPRTRGGAAGSSPAVHTSELLALHQVRSELVERSLESLFGFGI